MDKGWHITWIANNMACSALSRLFPNPGLSHSHCQ
jgi:hypothetical protein